MKKILLIALLLIGVGSNLNANVKDNQKACDNGDGVACLNLGILYNNGKEVPQDYKKSIKLYDRACNMGNTKGCYNLGVMYRHGQGVKKDYKKAMEFYKKSCDGDDMWGCRGLAGHYLSGWESTKIIPKLYHYIPKLVMEV